jgi:hypothetical protein
VLKAALAFGSWPNSLAPPSGLPAISPTRREISSGDAGSFSAKLEIGESLDDSLISPPVGEMHDRAEGGNVERRDS